ncbi:jg15068 [Pararge aegeria aegeria]|uniref:Jg15068 protein n=1 Tax=Pararge aegeria aegeria TaxID=348720 RepID=A0A8S4SPE2_9NEOP|nr:jg15068 [Pararge aegeria aegeria]
MCVPGNSSPRNEAVTASKDKWKKLIASDTELKTYIQGMRLCYEECKCTSAVQPEAVSVKQVTLGAMATRSSIRLQTSYYTIR